MVYYRYMVDRKLPGHETTEFRFKKPLCQVCGQPLARVAFREQAKPYQWQVAGWACYGCTIIDIEY